MRRVGRPSKEWVQTVMNQGVKIFGTKEHFVTTASNAQSLKDALEDFYGDPKLLEVRRK